MSRLADYFIVVGYDHEKERSNLSSGKILQRFPKWDWEDCPLSITQGIDLFCQPTGWALSTQRQQPTFFTAVLTDVDLVRHYSACLTFSETVTLTTSQPDDEDIEDHEHTLAHHSQMFAPKSLVIMSRLNYIETFRNCLGIIYTAYMDNLTVELEGLIGNLLGFVQVPPPGGQQIRFTLGAGDRQAIQPPLSATIPTTNNSTALLFEQLGIYNTLSLFSAALTDHKILFHSQSFSRITSACQALFALQYPLKCNSPFIPLLPSALLEILNTPTPFIAGVHSTHKAEIQDLFDVIIADLDQGNIRVPECVNIPVIPEPVLSRTVKALHNILHPELLSSDYAFPPSPKKPLPPEQKDKEIRAVFIRVFAELFMGYRSCLTVIRIHPEPFITFHKANFLGHKGMVENDFIVRVLDGVGFGAFITERGSPYRVCDIFDEVYATMQDQLKEEKVCPDKMMTHIKELAKELYQNENPNPQPYVQKVPKPTEGSYARIHQPPFPLLDEDKVNGIIEDGISKAIKSKVPAVRPRIVPMGPPITAVVDRQKFVDNNARRLEVLRNCVNFIFENKISDARVIFSAVLRALKSKVARLALTEELSRHIQSNRAMLEHQQFDLIVRLLNCALQNDSSMDENGVAAAVLPLATSFCRKLCTGVIQFSYTLVQDHAVWGTLQFWEAAFYQDVQKQIRQLYAPQYEEILVTEMAVNVSKSPEGHRNSLKVPGNGSSRGSSMTPEGQRRSINPAYKPRQIGALEIAAEQLRIWSTLSEEQQKEMMSNEESTVYSQAIHYANRIVYLRVPLDCNKSAKNTNMGYDDESKSTSNITASLAESDSLGGESGFDEAAEESDMATTVIRFVTKFVDKVCEESHVTEEHIKALHQMIPGVVAMHIETLEAVNREARRLPPIQKPKILTPTFLPGEEIVMEGLRAYLLPDGREEGCGGNMGGPSLLPAEGAIFLTTYRILFKGTPCDPLACELVITRAFPISTLTRDKKLNVQYIQHLDQWLQEGVQLRSNIFQFMKVAFDEEVSSESVETFRKLANKCRNPPTVFNTFALTGHQIIQPAPLNKNKEKNRTLRQFAKKTLLKTAKKARLKPKDPSRKQKYTLPTPPMPRRSLSPRSSDSDSERPNSEIFDEVSLASESEYTTNLAADPKNLEKLMERPGYQDFIRLGLGHLSTSGQRSSTEQFRITTVNANFSVCRSYPALLVVPQSVSDESIRKFARSHRQSRFPVITWKHPRTKALLLRASSFHSRGLMGMLKHNTTSSTSSGETTVSLEQEKYFSALVRLSRGVSRTGDSVTSYSDSLSSLDSLMMAGATADSLNVPDAPDQLKRSPFSVKSTTNAAKASFKTKTGSDTRDVGVAEATPNTLRRNMFSRAVNTLRSSGGKGGALSRKKLMANLDALTRIGSLKEKHKHSTLDSRGYLHPNGTLDGRGDLINSSVQGLRKVSVYILGEKAQMKGIKLESFPKCDFIPVDFYEVRHVKASFKKLMRACVPSSPPGLDAGFLKTVEDTEWLLQVQNIMQLAGATVDLLDVQGSSVMICLEDGWDVTTQVVSVAQILLDPYFRTLEGFKALIEKEWLSFGHRFTHRSNQTQANQASGFAPIFLQFLDVVHQIHHQFPLSFEFNQYYLKFLAYHYVSNRFRTFMLDNEFERMEAGWVLEEKKTPRLDELDEESGFAPKHAQQSSMGMSIWDFIDKHHRKSPIFYNFLYSPVDQEAVLRPYSNLSNLKIWDYYTTEDLSHGPSYDLDVVQKEIRLSDEQEVIDAQGHEAEHRRTINGCYDSVLFLQPDSFRCQFMEIHNLENCLGHLPRKWKIFWDKLESPNLRYSVQRQTSFNMQLLRSHGRSIHKRSTLEILVKGKMLGEAARMFSQPHRFEETTYTTPVYCDFCSQLLWGFVKTGMHCADCGYNCHEKCKPSVPKNCTKLKTVPDSSTSSSSISRNVGSEGSSISGMATLPAGTHAYEHYAPSSGEHRTHEGYLFKRGALLKNWKQRWFVLDSMKHQLRWYDAMEDSHYKGFIDLSEVESVKSISVKSIQGVPKKADENAFFELKTTRRFYHFLASDAKATQEWIDKIQGCIQ
ncbi:hypothetical protein ACJMK2_020304 [Sinanodonta woodiana]|uniref:Myotubularin-related protein 13 n=1 Tax=Sinanodonta woodiana TaxID=1069815 RepID=A0ABD3U1I9_SINWO